MSLFDLVDVVDDLADLDHVTVTRRAASTYTAGRLDTPSTSTFGIAASVQPTSGKDLQRLPEGSRTAETRTVYTSTELRCQTAAQAPDLLTLEGESWEVQTAENWGSVGAYWKCIVQKTGD